MIHLFSCLSVPYRIYFQLFSINMSFVINKEQRESQKEQSYSLQQWLLRGEIQKAGAVSGLPSVFISWQSSSESLAATWHPDTQRDSHKHTGMHNDVHWF